MTEDQQQRPERTHPDDMSSFELCGGCPACDLLARESVMCLEVDLERLSLELWVAGWRPTELIAEVRGVTGVIGSTGLVAQLLLVDDSHRSEQARPPAWSAEIEQLRARTGISDDAPGWLSRWIAANAAGDDASRGLSASVRALFDLVGLGSVG